jgi:hypothetical protein
MPALEAFERVHFEATVERIRLDARQHRQAAAAFADEVGRRRKVFVFLEGHVSAIRRHEKGFAEILLVIIGLKDLNRGSMIRDG